MHLGAEVPRLVALAPEAQLLAAAAASLAAVPANPSQVGSVSAALLATRPEGLARPPRRAGLARPTPPSLAGSLVVVAPPKPRLLGAVGCLAAATSSSSSRADSALAPDSVLNPSKSQVGSLAAAHLRLVQPQPVAASLVVVRLPQVVGSALPTTPLVRQEPGSLVARNQPLLEVVSSVGVHPPPSRPAERAPGCLVAWAQAPKISNNSRLGEACSPLSARASPSRLSLVGGPSSLQAEAVSSETRERNSRAQCSATLLASSSSSNSRSSSRPKAPSLAVRS